MKPFLIASLIILLHFGSAIAQAEDGYEILEREGPTGSQYAPGTVREMERYYGPGGAYHQSYPGARSYASSAKATSATASLKATRLSIPLSEDFTSDRSTELKVKEIGVTLLSGPKSTGHKEKPMTRTKRA